ncbi:hypothetical protein AC249_AIPGENE23050 [Exaiptasia diaphana]|nr:hypothetical protein AC249_AIPGENE23050 [Exaiptasia diaphana]
MLYQNTRTTEPQTTDHHHGIDMVVDAKTKNTHRDGADAVAKRQMRYAEKKTPEERSKRKFDSFVDRESEESSDNEAEVTLTPVKKKETAVAARSQLYGRAYERMNPFEFKMAGRFETDSSCSDADSGEHDLKANHDIATELEKCLLKLNVPAQELERKSRFVEAAVRELLPLWEFSSNDSTARPLLDKSIHAGSLIQTEGKMWLDCIYRRLSGRRSVRKPFYAEIHRSIPREFFNVLVSVVRGSDGFAPPFCYLSKNKKAEAISFTSIRLVKELFSLLTGLPSDEVCKNFRRTLSSGMRAGHKVSVLADESKTLCHYVQI